MSNPDPPVPPDREDEVPSFAPGGRVITIERLLADPETGRRNRERFQRVLVDAHVYGAYRPPPPDAGTRLPGYDLSRLSDAERAQLEALLEKARAATPPRKVAGGAAEP